ncbi:MAG: HdeD family acid-resistance protein [Actinomycetota bacterium]
MEVRERAAREMTASWWLFLITGVAWLIIAVVVLRFDLTSIASVGALLGVILLIAGVNEFMALGLRDVAWKWLHAALGVLFVIGGIWAFIHPIGAFYELASILGFLLILKGSMDLIGSVMQREVSELWWLGVITGGLEILLGFWASQQFFAPRAILILVWVGFFAIFRGVGEIVLAFEMRHAHKELGRHAMA